MTTAQDLLNKALKYRRMEASVTDPAAIDGLKSLAAEYAAKAGAMEEAERGVVRSMDAQAPNPVLGPSLQSK